MRAIRLTPALRREYEDLFESCVIGKSHERSVERIVDKILANEDRYRLVSDQSGVPWFFVAAVHSMESGRDFQTHLHNGDPLTARTVHKPKGRPEKGTPPFTWEESAQDALAGHRLNEKTDWTLAGTLYQLERYNGWGYRYHHPEVRSPYLWSFSNHYLRGKYVDDKTWSDSAVSKQCGAAVLLRRMAEHGMITFVDRPSPMEDEIPLVVRYSMSRSSDPETVRKVKKLQRFLNTHPGIFLKVDGIPGDRTSDAYRKVTGARLPGDPRG
ncbi:MAG: hypothetical protein P8182_15870 [Deltaproteobacteria bacterium]